MKIEIDERFLEEDVKVLGLSTKTYKSLKKFFSNLGELPTIGHVKAAFEGEYRDRMYSLHHYIDINGLKEVVTALKSFALAHNKQSNQAIQEIQFNHLMQTTLYELDLSVRSFNVLSRVGIDIVESIVRQSEEELNGIRNMGQKSVEEIISKIRLLGLDIRPETKLADEWIEELKLRFVTKSKRVQPKLDINNIPEEYRKTYAIGAGVVAKQELEQNSRVGVSKKVPTKSNIVADKPALPKVKISKQAITEMSDKQLLKVIAEDISIIESLEESFITKYRKDLIKIILANSTLGVDKRLELVELINNTQINTL